MFVKTQLRVSLFVIALHGGMSLHGAAQAPSGQRASMPYRNDTKLGAIVATLLLGDFALRQDRSVVSGVASRVKAFVRWVAAGQPNELKTYLRKRWYEWVPVVLAALMAYRYRTSIGSWREAKVSSLGGFFSPLKTTREYGEQKRSRDENVQRILASSDASQLVDLGLTEQDLKTFFATRQGVLDQEVLSLVDKLPEEEFIDVLKKYWQQNKPAGAAHIQSIRWGAKKEQIKIRKQVRRFEQRFGSDMNAAFAELSRQFDTLSLADFEMVRTVITNKLSDYDFAIRAVVRNWVLERARCSEQEFSSERYNSFFTKNFVGSLMDHFLYGQNGFIVPFLTGLASRNAKLIPTEEVYKFCRRPQTGLIAANSSAILGWLEQPGCPSSFALNMLLCIDKDCKKGDDVSMMTRFFVASLLRQNNQEGLLACLVDEYIRAHNNFVHASDTDRATNIKTFLESLVVSESTLSDSLKAFVSTKMRNLR